MQMNYSAEKWHWIVAGDESRAWSSEHGAYVDSYPADAVTRIGSALELNDVLRPYGLTLPAPLQSDYQAGIQAHVDATAKSMGYNDASSCAGYLSSTNPIWAAEASAFIAWRDEVWSYAFAELAKVQAGTRPQPSVSALIAELPLITWPV